MPKQLTRRFLRLIQLSSNLATLLSCRLVKWTGKSKQPLHPKHLVGDKGAAWYMNLVRPGDLALDLGAGTGVHAARCLRAGARGVVAADLSEARLVRARVVAADVAVWFVCCDGSRTLPLQSASLGGALLLDILEHLLDPLAALRECARVLKPGAWVAIALPNSQTKWKERYRRAGLFWMSDRDHKREFTWPEIAQLIEAAGLRLQSGPEPIALDTPLTGLADLVGGFSLSLYRRLNQWRARQLARHPQETTGFRCVAIKP
ncbi:class I SAM-dependent methyltransferase [Candidatus Sumerlaeota bacterium]|nr:class I SAM-dependent methyltransferase [Candidatus Sumerlaeota bacterium]